MRWSVFAFTGVRTRRCRARGGPERRARDTGREAAAARDTDARHDARVLLAHAQGAAREHAATRRHSREGVPCLSDIFEFNKPMRHSEI